MWLGHGQSSECVNPLHGPVRTFFRHGLDHQFGCVAGKGNENLGCPWLCRLRLHEACCVAGAHTTAASIAREFGPSPTSSIAQFASLGSGGAHPQNLERDLHIWAKHAFDLDLPISFIDVDLWDPHSWTESRVRLPVLMPCDVAAEAWRAGPPPPRACASCCG